MIVNNKASICISLAFCLLLANQANGQSKKQEDTRKSSCKEFDILSEKKSTYNIEDLISHAQDSYKSKPEKEETEKTAAYEKRLETYYVDSFRKKGFEILNPFLFKIKNLSSAVKYNADAENFTLSHSIVSEMYANDMRYHSRLIVNSKKEDASSYEASNSFGKTVTVIKETVAETGLEFFVKKNIYDEKDAPFTVWSRQKFKSSPQSYSSQKSSMQLFVVAKLNPPFVISEKRKTKPTISFPFDVETSATYLSGTILCAGIYALDGEAPVSPLTSLKK